MLDVITRRISPTKDATRITNVERLKERKSVLILSEGSQ